ncbi:MAG TPA: transglutaminase N-terminal domain-containing protein, partial [Polyangiaceae bacterium]|nr:transglutaminase N-terminal domain-containing protein [Polyangiaceae bacterium]
MAVRVALTHRTTYKYERPALMGPQVVRLRPAPHNRTPIHSYSLRLQPTEHFINWQQDPHGNYLARVVVPEKTQVFEVLVDLVADLESYNPFDFFLEPTAEEFPFKYSEATLREIAIYLDPDPMTPELAEFIGSFDQTKRRTVDYLVDLNRAVYEAVAYVIRMEPGVQTPSETLTLKKGSCRDSAWLMVQACRHLGLAARFVSGYLIQLEPDERPIHGPAGPEKDFTDLHAWCEVYVPGAGWIGLDPTSGLLAAEGHIPLACTPFPGSAAPVEGGVEKVETEFSFHMEVRRIVDVPRVTKPYTEEQ